VREGYTTSGIFDKHHCWEMGPQDATEKRQRLLINNPPVCQLGRFLQMLIVIDSPIIIRYYTILSPLVIICYQRAGVTSPILSTESYII
jgi:hypothetical protein